MKIAKFNSLALLMLALTATLFNANAAEWYEIGEFCPKLREHADYWREQWPYKDISDVKRGSSYLASCKTEINAYWKEQEDNERANNPLNLIIQDKEAAANAETDTNVKIAHLKEIAKLKAEINRELAQTLKDFKAQKDKMITEASKARGQS